MAISSRWFFLQNHEALGSTSKQDCGAEVGLWVGGRYRGEQGRSRGMVERTEVPPMPYNMSIPFLLYPPTPQHTPPTWKLKYTVRMTQDSKHQADWRTVRERRAQNGMKWSSTCLMVEPLDTFPVLLPECWQPVKLEDSALRKLKTSERQSPDNAICHLFD